LPIRGNLRRGRAGSVNLEENKVMIEQEIETINETVDFDDPRQIDYDLLIKGLSNLKEKRVPFNKPVYDKYFKVRLQNTEQVNPCPLIIVEGALIFCNKQLRDLFDLSIYIDTDDDVRLSRRVLKNASKQGKLGYVPLIQLLKTYEEKTKPAFEKFIEPTKKYANTIIPNYGFSTDVLDPQKMRIQGVDIVVTHVEQQINSH
jgi:uridine kinase